MQCAHGLDREFAKLFQRNLQNCHLRKFRSSRIMVYIYSLPARELVLQAIESSAGPRNEALSLSIYMIMIYTSLLMSSIGFSIFGYFCI